MQRGSVLIVAWYFPPDGGAGSQRPASFACELPKLGWDTTVLTRGEQRIRGRWEVFDASLVSAIGMDATVMRVVEESPIEGFHLSVEREITRKAGRLCTRVCELARESSPDVILLTMSPFCLASIIQPLRQETGSRIVIDLRDPWALDYGPILGSASSFRKQREFMLHTLTRVDGVIMNTSAAQKDLLVNFADRMKSGFEERVTVITNGFTREDFEGKVQASRSDKLQIIHTGTFHCEHIYPERSLLRRLRAAFKKSRAKIDRTGRTPLHLLRATSLLKSDCPEVFADIEFRFIGHVDEFLERCIADSGVSEKVSLEGYLPHDETVRAMCSSGALFLPGVALPAQVDDLIIPGKTYEYLASGRPIIGALNEGDARRLLEYAGGSYTCDPCSAESIASSLRRLHADWKAGLCDDFGEKRRQVLESHERSSLARELSSFLEKITELPSVYGRSTGRTNE